MTVRGWVALLPFLIGAAFVHGGFRLFVHPDSRAAAERLELQVTREGAPEGGSSPERDPGLVLAETARLEEELALRRTRVRSLWAPLAPTADPDEVLHSLRAVAAREQVEVLRFAPEAEVRLDRFRARAVRLALEGGFFGLLGFLDRVSALPQLVLIEDAQFDAAPTSGGRLRARLTAIAVRGEGPPFPVDAGTDRADSRESRQE